MLWKGLTVFPSCSPCFTEMHQTAPNTWFFLTRQQLPDPGYLNPPQQGSLINKYEIKQRHRQLSLPICPCCLLIWCLRSFPSKSRIPHATAIREIRSQTWHIQLHNTCIINTTYTNSKSAGVHHTPHNKPNLTFRTRNDTKRHYLVLFFFPSEDHKKQSLSWCKLA